MLSHVKEKGRSAKSARKNYNRFSTFLVLMNLIDPHNLRCTSSIATLGTTFPSLLLAAHWYSPLSALFKFIIVNFFLSSEELILKLLLVFIGDLFMVHDIVGKRYKTKSRYHFWFSNTLWMGSELLLICK